MTRCTGQKTHSFSEKKKKMIRHIPLFFFFLSFFQVGDWCVSIPYAEK